jgi:RNA polymerase sigma factor (sigma-70 family)
MGDLIADAGASTPPTPPSRATRSPDRGGADALDDRERIILVLRFGLGGEEPQTLEEIGAHFGPDPRAHPPDAEPALAKLRHPLAGAHNLSSGLLDVAHGVNEKTTAAVVGTTIALGITIGTGLFFIERAGLTGYASEEATFARFAVEGLDLKGLVLAGLIIGALGVLDDVTVSQASTVFALHDTDPSMTVRQVAGRAMTVGRDHIASTVNTLFLAYAGASLALLVLFSTGGLPVAEIVTSEVVAEEIVKTLVGSVGLITAVPADVTPISELFERGASRGYVLLSELQELYDPLTHPDNWVEDTAQQARDLGMQVLDDLVEDADRPEAQPLSASSDSVRQYLNEIGRTDLLTPEQEVDLAKRYQAGLAAAAILAPASKLTPAARRSCGWSQRGGERAKDHMIRANLRLVVSVARKFRGRGVDLLSLIQEGNLGLIRGVEKFDHTKGYKFSTYATWWIRQALQRGLANTGRTVRLPVHVHELMGKVRYAEFALLQQLGREPTEHEIAAELGLPVERLREVKLAAQDVASLDKPIGEDGDATMGELVADEDAIDPESSRPPCSPSARSSGRSSRSPTASAPC